MRTSPLHAACLERLPDDRAWTTSAGMRMPAAFPGESDAKTKRLCLADASHRIRAGLKGPAAAAQLGAMGLPVPEQPNRWCSLPNGGLVARLGLTEYFIDDDGSIADRIAALPAADGLYPVPRADAAMVLAGSDAGELLLQVCSMDFATFGRDQGALALTSMAGVSVLVIAQPAHDAPLYRIWCDPSFGPYLYRTLLGIVEELGGGPIGLMGLDRLAPWPTEANPTDADASSSNAPTGKP